MLELSTFSIAAWSGTDCTPWFGHITGPNGAVQGMLLTPPSFRPGGAGAACSGSRRALPSA